MDAFEIKFSIPSDERFGKLVEAFSSLRDAKLSEQPPDAEDKFWLGFFDSQALAHFWWPDEAERDEWSRRWLSTPVGKRMDEPSLKTDWHFASMIEAVLSGEYDLLECKQIAPGEGRLRFDPHAWPYGGSDSLVALIEAFDCKVTGMPKV